MAPIICSTMAPDMPSPMTGTMVSTSARTCRTSRSAPKRRATATADCKVADVPLPPSAKARIVLIAISASFPGASSGRRSYALPLNASLHRNRIDANQRPARNAGSQPSAKHLPRLGDAGRILVDDDLGIRKSRLDLRLDRIGNLVRLQQRQGAVDLQMQLDEDRPPRCPRSQVVDGEDAGIGRGDRPNPLALRVRQLAVHEHVQGMVRNPPGRVEDVEGDADAEDGVCPPPAIDGGKHQGDDDTDIDD